MGVKNKFIKKPFYIIALSTYRTVLSTIGAKSRCS